MRFLFKLYLKNQYIQWILEYLSSHNVTLNQKIIYDQNEIY